MRIQYDPDFIKQLKKTNVQIRKNFIKQIYIFQRNPNDPILRNHELRGEWKGYRSINVTEDWRALYEEIHQGEEIIAYFSFIGTHKDLYNW
ncbi:MAG TPA: type II toxin-antitoxin system mRNA interferase toxin, RelE/StbE family [Candidatus Saccharimonadales bacterium]|nr:type II toxin-antitoxin system mRNA interferase toxin, RelE/StbE family [Candidatus Saccharimonadales bacterium]